MPHHDCARCGRSVRASDRQIDAALEDDAGNIRALIAQYLADAGEPEPGSEAERVVNAAKAALGE